MAQKHRRGRVKGTVYAYMVKSGAYVAAGRVEKAIKAAEKYNEQAVARGETQLPKRELDKLTRAQELLLEFFAA